MDNSLRTSTIIGGVTGALSAVAVSYVKVGALPGIVILGACIGLRGANDCSGLELATYIAPGLIFGIVFGALLRRSGKLDPAGAVWFALASLVGNFLAVMVAVNVFESTKPLFGDVELPAELVGGLVAGAVGGGLLGRVTAALVPGVHWLRLLAVGAVLGLFLPLALTETQVLGQAGLYLFYIIWQGGYAAALVSSRRSAAATPAAA